MGVKFMIQILKNSIDLLASRFVNVLAQLGIVVLVSRRLGPDVFGEFAFLNAVVMTGIVAANFGLDTYMVRDISRDDSRGNGLIWAIFKFKTVSSVIVIGAIFVLFRYVLDTRSISNLLTLLSVTICLNSLSQSLWFYGDAFNRFRIHAFLWGGANLFRLGFIWLLLSYRNNLVMVVYAIILAEMVNLVISYATVKAKFNIKPVPIPLHELATLLKKSYPMALIFILSVLYFRIDLIMLKLATTAKAVGYYAASLRIVEFIGIIPGTIYMAAFPVLSKDYVHDQQAFYAGARKSLLMLGPIALFMALFVYFLSPGIIGILYGPAFSASAEILRIMTGVIFLIFFSGYFAYFHMAMGNEKLVAAILIVATLFKTLSNYFLIPGYGPVGSAFAALFSESVIVVLYIIPLLLWVRSQKHPAPPVEVVADERS